MDEFWNDPLYKPQNKICAEFWDEFMAAARILMAFDYNLSPEEKAMRGWEEPDIYAVFNKLRQDIHTELPYNENFIKGIDESIEREFARERRARGNAIKLS